MAATKARKKDSLEEERVVAFEAPEDRTEEAGDPPREKKRGGFKRFLFLFIFLLGAGTFLYLTVTRDWGGVRTKLIHAASSLDPNYRALNDKIAEYNLAQRDLEEAQEDLERKRQELETLRATLNRQQSEIREQQTTVKPIYEWGFSEAKIAEFTQIGEVYSLMDPADAADRMSRLYDVSHVAVIIYYMKPAAAAEVLAAMNPDLAAKVTSEFLRT